MRLLPLAPLALLLLPAACDMHERADAQGYKGGGVQGARVFMVDPFQRVSLRGPDDVVVRVGGPFSVRAEGDRAILSHLRIGVVGGELRVERDHDTFGWRAPRGSATVFVSLPRIQAATVTGSGDMKVDKVSQDRFEAAVSGSGDLGIGALLADQSAFTVAGSGDLHVVGKTGRAALTLSGSGRIEADALEADALTVSAVGSGDVAAWANGTARISVIGSGDVAVKGKAKCTVSRLGSGNAVCGG